MNKKFLSAILFGALMITSTGTFVSCKDYDDDIDGLQEQIDANAKSIADLKALIDGANYVTNVTVSGNNLVVTTKNGGTTNVALPEHEDNVGSICTVEGGELYIDGKATGIKVTEEAPKSEFKPAVAIVEGEWAVLQEDGTYKSTGVKASSVTVTGNEKDGWVLTIDDQVIELPSAASLLSEVEFVGWLNPAGEFIPFSAEDQDNNKYEVNYYGYYSGSADIAWEWVDADESQKYKNKIAKETAITILEGSALVARIAPATVDASDIDFTLVNSKLQEAPVTLGTAEAYNGLVTRAASGNGLWVLPMESVTANNVASDYLTKQFNYNNAQIAFALKAAEFVSNYNLVFATGEATKTNVYLNYAPVADKDQVVVKQNEDYTFAFDVPTSVYDSKIIVDEVNAQNWGVEIDGNTFKVTKYYDKATIPYFPVYFYYYDLVANSEVKLTINVRLERSIAGVTTLDAKAHTINADITKDNFSASIKPMYEGMTSEQLNNWKEYVHKTEVAIYQVGVGANGTDEEIEDTYYNSIQLLDKNNAEVTSRADMQNGNMVTVKVDLSQKWAGSDKVTSAGKYSLDGEYYVLVSFKDEAGDVLSQVKLPFTLSIPKFTDIFVHQDGIWVNDVAQAYMYEVANRGANADKKSATYTIKNAFKTLKANMADAFTFSWAMDAADANKIGGKKHSQLASLSAADITSENVETATITLTENVGGANNANGTQKGYGQDLIINVTNAKFLDKYAYGTANDVDYTFKLKVMSPILEGKVYAVDNKVKLDATSLTAQKVDDSHIKAHTYNTTQVYSIFSDKAAPDYWKRDELKSVTFASGNAELFSVTKTGTTYVPASGSGSSAVAAVNGYAEVTINNNANISVETESHIKVTVEDAWGYKLTQEVPVLLQVTK